MLPGPAFFRDMHVSKKDSGPWQPEARGETGRRADPSVTRGTPEIYIRKIIIKV